MYILYKTINNVNGKFYIGVHKTDTPHIFDGYFGSGIAINKAIKKYGRENFTRETLFVFYNKKDAYNKEMEVVNEDFIKNNNYNMRIGGCGGSMKPSEETKQKIKNTLIKNGTSSGKNNPMFGKFGIDHPKFNKGMIIQKYDKLFNLVEENFLSYFIKNGFSPSMIYHCCAMRHKSHKGFIFRYKDDKAFVFPILSNHGNAGIIRKCPS